jgi:hypothetical protein
VDYDIRDLARYAGFIVGCSGTFVLLGFLGVEMHLVKLIGGVVVGAGLGYAGHLATEPKGK